MTIGHPLLGRLRGLQPPGLEVVLLGHEGPQLRVESRQQLR
jgi:hypothetical protein